MHCSFTLICVCKCNLKLDSLSCSVTSISVLTNYIYRGSLEPVWLNQLYMHSFLFHQDLVFENNYFIHFHKVSKGPILNCHNVTNSKIYNKSIEICQTVIFWEIQWKKNTIFSLKVLYLINHNFNQVDSKTKYQSVLDADCENSEAPWCIPKN